MIRRLSRKHALLGVNQGALDLSVRGAGGAPRDPRGVRAGGERSDRAADKDATAKLVNMCVVVLRQCVASLSW